MSFKSKTKIFFFGSNFLLQIISLAITLKKANAILKTCEFIDELDGETRRTIRALNYSDEAYNCVVCPDNPSINTLMPSSIDWDPHEICHVWECNGLLCNVEDNCFDANERRLDLIERVKDPCKTLGRNFPSRNDDKLKPAIKSQAPLIIGFAVGGLMLAVVIVGVFLGRANRGSPHSDSAATTPVSMSYSEWVSNYSVGGRGSKVGNTRVQETGSLMDMEDAQGLAVYSIVYGEDVASTEGFKISEEEPPVIEVDDMTIFDETHNFQYRHPEEEPQRYFATPVFDGNDTVTVEWTDDNSFAPSAQRLVSEQMYDSNADLSPANSSNVDWSQADKSSRNNSVYLKRPDAWSDDGSELGDKTSSKTPLNSQYALPGVQIVRPSEEKSFSPPNVNFANLKHVFVDVHRSMEELRKSQLRMMAAAHVTNEERERGIHQQRIYDDHSVLVLKHHNQASSNCFVNNNVLFDLQYPNGGNRRNSI